MKASPTFVPAIHPSVPWETRQHIQLLYQKLGNMHKAVGILSGKEPTTSGGITSIIQSVTQGGGGTGSGDVIGSVNDQTGQATYTTQVGDDASLIVFNNASPVAVTLNGPAPPWCVFVTNLGSGVVTLTPNITMGPSVISYAGNIGAASMPLKQGDSCFVAYDGANWWALAVTPPVASNAIPLADSGAGSAGVSDLYSRSDHVHPSPGTSVMAYRAVSTAYLVTTSDQQIECTSGTFTVTLPSAVGITGQVFSIKNSGAGVVTLATTSAQTIDGVIKQTLTQYDNLVVSSNGANWMIV